jgi:hypothetical protein
MRSHRLSRSRGRSHARGQPHQLGLAVDAGLLENVVEMRLRGGDGDAKRRGRFRQGMTGKQTFEQPGFGGRQAEGRCHRLCGLRFVLRCADKYGRHGRWLQPDGRRAEVLTLGGVPAYDMPKYNTYLKVKGLTTIITRNSVHSPGVAFGWGKKF